MGEVGVADTSQEETEEGAEAGEVGGRPDEVVGEEEVGQGGEGGEGQDGPPAVLTAVLQVKPLTATQCHSDSPVWGLTRSELTQHHHHHTNFSQLINCVRMLCGNQCALRN